MNLSELLNIDKKLIILKNVNGDSLGVLNVRNKRFCPRFNDVSTFEFTVDKSECPYYDLITSWRIIEIQDIGRFLISKPTITNDGLNESKTVVCNSYEYDINRKMIPYLSGTYKFYSIDTQEETILSIIMSYLPNWSIESVDDSLWSVYRTFDVSDISVYQFMQTNCEEAFQCVFTYNTLNNTIKIQAFENIPKSSDIYLSFNNLVNELNITEDTENLITSMSVFGANDLSINLVNPLGNTIYNFQHFKTTEFMSSGLITAIDNWESAIATNQTAYTEYLTQRKTKIAELVVLQSALTTLESEYDSIEITRDALLEAGLNATIKNAELSAKRTEIINKENEITAKQSEITAIETNLTNIQNIVAINKFFSVEQLAELEPFIINVSVTDENFIKGTEDTDDVIQQTAQDLYDKYKGYLDKNSKMKYKFSIDLINFISLEEYKNFTDQLQWGITVNLETETNQGIAYPMLLGLNIDEDSEIEFLFGEELRYESVAMSYEDYLANQLSSIANTVNGSPIKWGDYINSGDKDRNDNFFKVGLQADLLEVANSANQEVGMNSSGLYGRKLLENGNYDLKQWKMINNKLIFTKSGWNDAEMAVGEITLPDGSKSYGISASVILGNLIAGNQLIIKNSNNKFVVDANGANLTDATLSISNLTNKILLDPTNGFKIQKNIADVWTDMIYMDVNGDANFKGIITASEVNGSTIYGGSIDIGNGDFTVDSSGNVDMAGTLTVGGNKLTFDYLTAEMILEAPVINAAEIYGGAYFDTYGKGKLVLNPNNSTSNNADLYLYSGANIAFKIYDGVAGFIELFGYGNNFLTVASTGTTLRGNWDFSLASLTGISSVAKFA